MVIFLHIHVSCNVSTTLPINTFAIVISCKGVKFLQKKNKISYDTNARNVIQRGIALRLALSVKAR